MKAKLLELKGRLARYKEKKGSAKPPAQVPPPRGPAAPVQDEEDEAGDSGEERRRPRHRRRRRSRSRDRRSDSDNSSSASGGRRSTRRGLNLFERLAARHPGLLMAELLEDMRKFMVGRQGMGAAAQPSVDPVAVAYLTSVFQPAHSELGLRDNRELRTLAEALDLLTQGQSLSAGDVLAQRFRAIEMASTEKSWSLARHLELIPDGKVTTTSQRARAEASRLERLDQKLRQPRPQGNPSASPGRGRPAR